MEVLCSVMMQPKMESCIEKALAGSKEEALWKAKDCKAKALVRIERKWKVVRAVLDTGAGPNMLKETCLPRARARHAVTVKATRLRSAADTQLPE